MHEPTGSGHRPTSLRLTRIGRGVAGPLVGLLLGFAATPTTSKAAEAVAAEEFARHAVVSQEAHASEVGRDVLRRGGNAVDAAVATAFALAVTHPSAGNLGGGGFLVAFLADQGEVVTVDFRESAPAAAEERMYLGPDGLPTPRHRAGPRAAGVPGTVRGLAMAHERWGQAAWADLVRPAATLAREGFPVSETLAGSLNAQLFQGQRTGVVEDLGPDAGRLADFPASVAAYRKPDGHPWQAGDLLLQRDLAETFDRIAAEGPDDFYRGRTARAILTAMQAGGGLISAEDLRHYRAILRPPVHTTYKGMDIYGMGPPSSGGIVVAQSLNILERFDLKADGPKSPRTIHRVAEALRRGFLTRATAVADPDFVEVPVAELVSKRAADELARTIDDRRATPSAALAPFGIEGAEGSRTTHLSTIDGQGNAVALTYTLEQGYGSKAVVAGCGFLLNNEMGDFNLVPGLTDTKGRVGTPANRIAPRKRMLSSMAPTLVLQGGKVRVVTGSPGGRTIPSTTVCVLLNLLEFGLDARSAVDAPRLHHPWMPDILSLEGESWPAPTREALTALGHVCRITGPQGDAHTLVVDLKTGRRVGVADRRRQTSKAAGD